MKETNRLWKNVRDFQGTNFAIGRTMTARGWGEQACEWADSDGSEDAEQWLIENGWKSEEKLIANINDVWEIEIKPQEDWTEEEKELKEEFWWEE